MQIAEDLGLKSWLSVVGLYWIGWQLQPLKKMPTIIKDAITALEKHAKTVIESLEKHGSIIEKNKVVITGQKKTQKQENASLKKL